MKHILFDLDGTLTDSGAGIIHCAQETLAHYGLPIPNKEELRVIVGPPLRDSLLRYGIPPENINEAVEIYRKHYMDHGRFENFPYPGIEDLLQRLKQAGHRLFVATSKPEAMAQDILSHFHLAHYFDLICGAADDHRRNSKSDVIRHLLEQLSPGPDCRIVMVGDTIFDIEGANALQLPSIGVSWGYGNTEDMKNAGALGIADSMQQLHTLIDHF